MIFEVGKRYWDVIEKQHFTVNRIDGELIYFDYENAESTGYAIERDGSVVWFMEFRLDDLSNGIILKEKP